MLSQGGSLHGAATQGAAGRRDQEFWQGAVPVEDRARA